MKTLFALSLYAGLHSGLLFAPPSGTAPGPAPAAPSVEPVSDPDSPIAATARLSPDPSAIGDLLELEVVVAYPQGFTVNLPIGLELAPLEVVRTEADEPESSGTGLRRTFRIALQHFEVGELETPQFPLTYVDLQGSVETFTVPSASFTVESLLANEVDETRRADDPPVSLPYPNTGAETAIIASVAAAILALIGAAFWLHWRRREKPVVVPPPIPAHVVALEALDGLEGRREEMVESGAFQDYYLQLTEIAKGYIQGRFAFDALDRTTEEIRRDLVRVREQVAPLDADEFIKFLQACDLVKFARFAPPADDAKTALGTVRTMVFDTKDVPQRPAPSADAAEDGPGARVEARSADGTGSGPGDDPGDGPTDGPGHDREVA